MGKIKLTLFAITSSLVISACGAGGSDSVSEFIDDLLDDDQTASSDYISDSSGDCGKYVDIVSPTEQEQANACGIQVSSHYANAAVQLNAAQLTCQAGDISSADQNYANYETAIELARATKDALCPEATGGSNTGGSFEDTSDPVYAVLCINKTPQQFSWVCIGNRQYSDTSCADAVQQFGGSWVLAGQFNSESECDSEARQMAQDAGYQ